MARERKGGRLPGNGVQTGGPQARRDEPATSATGQAARARHGGAAVTRDARFVAVHRGGPLDLARHRLLASWAADCAEHVLPLFAGKYPDDERPRLAIQTVRAWARGEVTVGEARAAA